MKSKTVIEEPKKLSAERIAHLEELVEQARTAAAVFTQYTQEDVDRIVKPMVLAGMEHAQQLAQMAVEETKLGVLEDKVIKNMVATEFVYNYVKDKRTVGVIREYPGAAGNGDRRADRGDLFAVADHQSDVHRVLFKCIMAIKTRNAMIFSPHPRAWRCCQETVKVMYEAARETRRAGRSVRLPGIAHPGRQRLPHASQRCRTDRRHGWTERGEGRL